MIARFWVLVVGLELGRHVADIKPLGLKCGSKWFFAGVVDMFDLTQLLDAGVVVAWRRRLATRPSSLEDHSPRQACFKTRLSVLGLSRCHDTHVNTQCCGSPPCGLIVDRHLSVNSGARYA